MHCLLDRLSRRFVGEAPSLRADARSLQPHYVLAGRVGPYSNSIKNRDGNRGYGGC
jgi:hypothetical protein